MSGMNGNTRWVIGVLGFIILAGTTIATVTMSVSGKADRVEVNAIGNRITAVESAGEGRDRQLDRIEDKLTDIQKLLREAKGK